MLAKKLSDSLRTWVEIDSKAAKKNYETFRGLLRPKTKLWAVVKSNAYGHGLVVFSKLADKLGVDGFCVDSLVEGLRLREVGITKEILVLGPTLPSLLPEAVQANIVVTVASKESLNAFVKEKSIGRKTPRFHIKIDSGMNRQGMYVDELQDIVGQIKRSHLGDRLEGIYTHFSSAKDINYPTYTQIQFKEFQRATELLKKAGFKDLVEHCAATGGALLDAKYHLDAVRIGIGLYGCWPSKELEIQLPDISLEPVLNWRTVISDIKLAKKGSYVGYDLAERIFKDTKIAILPVGYWHGFPRSLSGRGEVLVSGKRVRVLGRVSMDIAIVDVMNVRCSVGDIVTLIGKDIKDEISAFEIAQRAETVHYEFLTRLNPLMERILV